MTIPLKITFDLTQNAVNKENKEQIKYNVNKII